MQMRIGALLIVLLLSAQAAPAQTIPEEIYFGSVAMDIPAVMHERLTPLTEYLSQELGVPVILKLSPAMPAAIKEVSQGNVHLAYLTPVAYLRSHEAGHTRVVAKTVTKGRASFQLMIVVGENSDITSVEDLAGRSFAFGDRAALLQRATVVGAGIGLEDLGSYSFIGHYDNIVRGVLHGDYDAGILKDTMAFKWEGKGVRTLYASPNLPPYNITASAGVSDELFVKIQEAFLSLDASDPADLAVIKSIDPKYDGFASTNDEEYDVVRQLIAPFDSARKAEPGDSSTAAK
jgi:phosphonate transport system substrate-binding protein